MTSRGVSVPLIVAGGLGVSGMVLGAMVVRVAESLTVLIIDVNVVADGPGVAAMVLVAVAVIIIIIIIINNLYSINKSSHL